MILNKPRPREPLALATESRVLCVVCQLWKVITDIAEVYSSGGLCESCKAAKSRRNP